MVTLDKYGYASLLMPLKKTVSRRQDVQSVFNITTVAYVSNPDHIMNANELFGGKTRAVIIPEERALDIDTELDFKLAELLAREGFNKGM